MKNYTCEEPTFSDVINIVETSDPAHADNINASVIQLQQNLLVIAHLFDEDVIQAAIEEAFPKKEEPEQPTDPEEPEPEDPDKPQEPDPEAMTDEEILDATENEYDGSSSDDPTAMSSEEVDHAVENWNGETSDDPTAITSDEVDEVTQ